MRLISLRSINSLFTPFLFQNAHSAAFSSAKSKVAMRISNAQMCKYNRTFCHHSCLSDKKIEDKSMKETISKMSDNLHIIDKKISHIDAVIFINFVLFNGVYMPLILYFI